MEFVLPPPYRARPYRGAADHSMFATVLSEYHRHCGDTSIVTVAQFDATYANLVNCDPDRDIAVIETGDGEPVAYVRNSWEEQQAGGFDYIVFNPTRPAHLSTELYAAIVIGQERHLRALAAQNPSARLRAFAPHPGPGLPATGEAAWLEALGYRPIKFGAALVRPHLDEIPDLPLADGVEVRPVTPEQIRPILEAHWEAFRGEWDFREASEGDFQQSIENPLRDESLWKVAWHRDTIVGQVKSYINPTENTENGYLRGYTEEISTHADWRNQGIAGALLAASLRELKSRGYTEAALGADTENPGGAFYLYTKLGFELRAYEAIYAKPMN